MKKINLFLVLVLILSFFSARFANAVEPNFKIINPYNGADGAGPYSNWYGIVSHTHTTVTGADAATPDQLFTLASALNVKVVPINDKDVVTADPGNHPGQYYLPGYEDVTDNPHLICIGCTSWTARTSIQDGLDMIKSQGGISIIPHPSFTNMTWSNVSSLTNIDGIETYNGQGYIGWDMWDNGLFNGRKWLGVGGNDMYSWQHEYAAVMFVNSPTDSLSDIMANFKAGNFYGANVCYNGAQCGGQVDRIAGALRVTQNGNTLTARFQVSETDATEITNRGIKWICGRQTAGSVCGTGNNYTVVGDEKYVRPYLDVYGEPDEVWGQAIYIEPIPIDTTVPTIPIADQKGGDYKNNINVFLTSVDDNLDAIYYTEDGSDPTISSTLYVASSGILVDKGFTLKALAFDKIGNSSGIMTEIYTVSPVVPTENIPPVVNGGAPLLSESFVSPATSVDINTPTVIAEPLVESVVTNSDVATNNIVVADNVNENVKNGAIVTRSGKLPDLGVKNQNTVSENTIPSENKGNNLTANVIFGISSLTWKFLLQILAILVLLGMTVLFFNKRKRNKI
ncbi:chitobiase/beta-hexosaminidase C-terminal domain-containing protein [Candidatus Nomurabacteria bacterium]|nr:chitobiase/beta-hexosaminidase C-terminal domain-containing protein [Candidatus Nomurabacteria bacterium]